MEQDVGKPNQKEMNAGAGKQGPSPGGGGLQEASNLDFVLDIPLEVSVELGRARILISELLQLGRGSVIELNKLAGEPVEIFINQKLIARGEVMVINDKFGIKMTEILSPMERVKQLGT
jgi:flagellar motor switch protein FliN/FliY